MIEVGTFPFAGRVADSSAAPRVGDGVLTLDSTGTVTYVSPNANSALHRVGIQANPVGMRLAELGFHDGPVRQAFERRRADRRGVRAGQRCHAAVPLRAADQRRARPAPRSPADCCWSAMSPNSASGTACCSARTPRSARSTTGSRTTSRPSRRCCGSRPVASRTPRPRRRCRSRYDGSGPSHWSTSRCRVKPGEDIAFIEIVRPLLRLAEESLQSPDRPVRFAVSGDGGRIPANTATPLSVVLTELLQNAVDHGFPEGSGGGDVNVALSHHDGQLTVRVVDNGSGGRSLVRTRHGAGPRPVDRAHAGDHRTQRCDRDTSGDDPGARPGRDRRRIKPSARHRHRTDRSHSGVTDAPGVRRVRRSGSGRTRFSRRVMPEQRQRGDGG